MCAQRSRNGCAREITKLPIRYFSANHRAGKVESQPPHLHMRQFGSILPIKWDSSLKYISYSGLSYSKRRFRQLLENTTTLFSSATALCRFLRRWVDEAGGRTSGERNERQTAALTHRMVMARRNHGSDGWSYGTLKKNSVDDASKKITDRDEGHKSVDVYWPRESYEPRLVSMWNIAGCIFLRCIMP